MVRGCQKKIVYLKNTDSEVFDEAYFLLTDKAIDSDLSEKDMLKEANRILDECIFDEENTSKKLKIKAFIKNKVLPFLIGMFIGVFCALIII